MTELVFDCLGAAAERYAAVPTINFRLRIAETTGARVHAIALRCQFRIEPVRRRYSTDEEARLLELFGASTRWGDTLQPLQLATVAVMAPGFTGSVEIDVPLVCTYDFEVATAKYFHALEEGEIPLLLLFSGTVFTPGETGFSVEQVPWHKETTYRLPVAVWDELMNYFFPNSTWIRLHRDTIDALQAYKVQRALPSWDHALEALLAGGGERP